MADDHIKSLEAAMARAVEGATLAQANLDAARKRLGLKAEPKQFYTAAERRAERLVRDEQERQNYRGIVETARIIYRPTKAEQEYDERMRRPITPRERAEIAWLDTLAKADAIVRERAAEKAAAAKAATVTATADAILRAGKIARGEIVELPTGETARAIIAAGRKRRTED
jgi:hypothetical protein